MAPGVRGIRIQKQPSKRQPYPAAQGRRVRQSGCWGVRPALASQRMGKGPAVSMQALGPEGSRHYSKWLRARIWGGDHS